MQSIDRKLDVSTAYAAIFSDIVTDILGLNEQPMLRSTSM